MDKLKAVIPNRSELNHETAHINLIIIIISEDIIRSLKLYSTYVINFVIVDTKERDVMCNGSECVSYKAI